MKKVIILTITLFTSISAYEEGLKAVRGVITNFNYYKEGASPTNPLIVSGEGFTLKGGTEPDRKMQVIFDTPFTEIPAITVTSNMYGDLYGKGTSYYKQCCYVWNDDGKCNGDYKNNFWVRCGVDGLPGSMATQINFIAIGK